jgi:hypothetical protein
VILLVFALLYALAHFSYFLTRDIFNPVILLVVCFFCPAVIATMRLSALQSNSWQFETYVLLFQAAFLWLVLPIVFLAGMARDRLPFVYDCQTFSRYGLIIFGVSSFAFLLSNVIQAGTLIPMLRVEIVHEIHASFPPILGTLAKLLPVAGILLLLGILGGAKTKMNYVLYALCFLIPLSRMARIDVTTLLVASLFIYIRHKNLSIKQLIVIACPLLVFLVGFAELGLDRTNRFGIYNISYYDVVMWKNEPVVGEWLPILYAYFPLSFENLDRFIAQNPPRTYGMASMSWLFEGLLKLHWFIPDFAEGLKIRDAYIPVSLGATVPTALSSFFMDFGIIGAWIPMLICIVFLLWLYKKSQVSVFFMGMYSLYGAAFSLASFQAIIVGSATAFQLLCFLLVINKYRRDKRKHEQSLVVF